MTPAEITGLSMAELDDHRRFAEDYLRLLAGQREV